MATHSNILAWKIPWTEAWRATVLRVAKSRNLGANNSQPRSQPWAPGTHLLTPWMFWGVDFLFVCFIWLYLVLVVACRDFSCSIRTQAGSLPVEPKGKPKNTGVGSLSLLQRIFLTQESNQGLLHCR